MLFSLVDILQTKRRLLYIAVFIIFDIWLLLLCNQTLQVHRASLTGRVQNYETIQALTPFQQDAIYSNSSLPVLDRALDGVEAGALRALLATSDGITSAEDGVQAASKATVYAASVAVSASVHAVGAVITGTAHVIGNVITFSARVITFPFVAIGRGVSYAVGGVSKATSGQLASVIQPKKDIDAPVITPEQAQQVTLIQENTVAVKPVKPVGSGGACDNGAGNGGYPIEWCDARMDTLQTVSYSTDRINRECTSYAYWYFTTIGGHTDFHVSGNANRWARTSNYPTHTAPAVGAIAVETDGYYGHVAIVQALPGATFDGKIVPQGYVLVSEMNYDWQGHFRYSYSPIDKFEAYIYP